MKVKLYHGDCLEVMKDIPNKSIDMILCDLPYGTTACKWDVVIPFEPLWIQYKRIIKDRGCIALFGSEPFSSMLIMSNLKMFKYCWYWEKPHTGQLNCHKMPLKNVEDVCIFQEKIKYYPQFQSGKAYTLKRENYKGSECYGNQRDHITVSNGQRYPKQILKYSEVNKIHPTQKPVALLEYLIKTYTLEGETVLDNCMGSGSTGVACKNLNRDFIGIEKDDKYFEIAKNRIDNHKPQGQLFEG